MPEDRNVGAEMKAYLDAELRKLTLLPPSELQMVLGPFLEPLAQMAQLLQTAKNAWIKWIEQNYEALVSIGEVIRAVTAKVGSVLNELEEASQRFAEMLLQVERLADFGWTLPTQLSMTELVEFISSPDAGAAESYLLGYLDASDPELTKMEARLVQEERLVGFRTILPQCFSAFRRAEYAITIQPLISMLERLIQTLNPSHLHANTDVLKTLHERGEIAHRAQEDLFCGAVWLSLFMVASQLWIQLPLNIPENVGLSRNGIHHGRIEPPNTKTEVIRLLNAVETALALHKLLDEDAGFSLHGSEVGHDLQPMLALIRANFFLPRRNSRFDVGDGSTDRPHMTEPGRITDADSETGSF